MKGVLTEAECFSKPCCKRCFVTILALCFCRKEAARDAANEPVLSSFMYASILSHDNFLECLAFVLANRMSNPTVLATEYFDAFMTTFTEHDEIVQAALDDLQAVRERVRTSDVPISR